MYFPLTLTFMHHFVPLPLQVYWRPNDWRPSNQTAPLNKSSATLPTTLQTCPYGGRFLSMC